MNYRDLLEDLAGCAALFVIGACLFFAAGWFAGPL